MLKRKKEPPERKASTLQESSGISPAWMLPQPRVDRLKGYRSRLHEADAIGGDRESLLVQALEDKWIR